MLYTVQVNLCFTLHEKKEKRIFPYLICLPCQKVVPLLVIVECGAKASKKVTF